MTQPRTPRWYRLHSATVIVLICLASIFAWLNFVHKCDRSYIKDYTVANGNYVRIWETFKDYGWPYKQELTPPIIVYLSHPSLETSGKAIELPIELPNITDDYNRVYADAAIALAILAGVTFLLEVILRRSTNRQHACPAPA